MLTQELIKEVVAAVPPEVIAIDEEDENDAADKGDKGKEKVGEREVIEID